MLKMIKTRLDKTSSIKQIPSLELMKSGGIKMIEIGVLKGQHIIETTVRTNEEGDAVLFRTEDKDYIMLHERD
jgi:hypothetical protein